MTLQQAKSYLQKELLFIYDVREASHITNMALEHVTQLSTTEQIIKKNEPLSATQIEQVQRIKTQLLQHKPIQQIVGYTWFAGQKFKVNEHVLIPRPETDELVNWIIDESKNLPNPTILDIGTGSGCIALSLAKLLLSAAVTALDISEQALQIANENSKELMLDVNFIHLDFLNEKHWASLPNYSIIVSNPPYIKQAEAAQMHENVLLYEPHEALFVPNNDALVFYEAIAHFAQTHLAQNGCIYVEINEALGKETEDVFAKKGFKTILKKDLQGKDRMIKACC